MTRKVTGSLVKADTTALADVYIYFRPLAVVAYTTGSAMVSLAPVEITTDTSGAFEVTLYTTGDWNTSTSEFIYTNMGYRIEIPELGLIRLVTVPTGTSDINWNSLGTEMDV